MRFEYKGRFESYDQLPVAELPENAVMYEEPDTIEEVAKVATKIGLLTLIPVMILIGIKLWWSISHGFDLGRLFPGFAAGAIASMAAMLPHEYLHGLCYPKQAKVEIYQAISKGILFVISTYPITKMRFIWMSACPNVIFGLLPLVIHMAVPAGSFLSGFTASMAICSLASAGGDILNIYNTLKQVPEGALVVLSGMHSYWYEV